MCEPCREKFARVTDAERPCDRPGCDGTWTWTAKAQLEAFATDRAAARDVRRLRGEAGRARGQAAPLHRPRLHAHGRLHAARAAPGRRARDDARDAVPLRCVQCESVYRKLKDRAGQLRHQRLQAASGSGGPTSRFRPSPRASPNEPPRRMCDACRADFGKLADREVRCRTSGCKKTWTWSRCDQLDACVAGKPRAQGAAPHVRELLRPLPDAQGRRAPLPPQRLQADLDRQARRPSWRAPCAARPAIPIRSTARSARRSWAISRTGRSRARPRTAPAPGPGRKQAQLAAGVRPEPKVEEHRRAKTRRGEPSRPSRRAAEAPAAAPETVGSHRRGAGQRTAAPTAATSRQRQTGQARAQRTESGGARSGRPSGAARPAASSSRTRRRWRSRARSAGRRSTGRPRASCRPTSATGPRPAMCGACKRDATEAARAIEREALRAAVTAAQPRRRRRRSRARARAPARRPSASPDAN